MSAPCSAITLVTFDVGGTLLTFRPDLARAYADVLAEAGCLVSEERIAAALEAERRAAAQRRAESVPADHLVSVEAGNRRRQLFVSNVLRAAGVPEERIDHGAAAVHAALDSSRMYQAYDDALPVLRALWERGLKLGAIANTWPSMPRILMELGFGDYLGFWVISEAVGVEKPHPAIFEKALEIGAAKPSHAIHIGDDYARDVLGARGVGMEAVLLDRSGRMEPGIQDGVPVIQQLNDLVEIIG
ncbi:MAG TPA: HAD-IA family hydrolase [Nitrolancea sp.]|nr:HAD-IA family hydrolase [Nitrolancea sp.]